MEDQSPPAEMPGPRPTGVFCRHCGFNLTGVAIGGPCPECGVPVDPTFQAAGGPASGKAIASMVIGIVSIVGCMTYGLVSIVCGPLAIYLARSARRDIATGGVSPNSDGMARAGFITGIIGTILGVLGLGFIAVWAFAWAYAVITF